MNGSTLIEDFTDVFLTYTVIDVPPVSVLTFKPIPVLCRESIPHAIPLTDAFNFRGLCDCVSPRLNVPFLDKVIISHPFSSNIHEACWPTLDLTSIISLSLDIFLQEKANDASLMVMIIY